MALGGQMRDDVGLEFGDRGADGVGVADVAPDEAIAVRRCDALDRRQRTGIGQLVEVQDFVTRIFDQVADERRADEAGPAGDEDAHCVWVLRQAARAGGRHRGRGCRSPQGQAAPCPSDAAVILRRIGVRTFISDFAIGFQRQEAVREPNWDEELVAIVSAELGTNPLTVGRRAFAHIDRDVKDASANAADQLGLSARRCLEMQAAQRVRGRRQRMIVLHECVGDPKR
ncbi:hypothetical protein WR25_21004 [Diploscapter pachys]|uniref:Uncharacterized protein n=1 Tax=Diploscapter pachys TaxID=2018661 RepID=A0A2A2KG37_9BILA|nr:hypothetical protein WR25_21004 [Diploscapter pachys]